MKYFIWSFIFIAAMFSTSLYAADTVNVASDSPPQEGNLNNAVQSAITAGTLSNTVFKLDAGGYYVLTASIIVPAGQQLTVVAPAPTSTVAPPQIVWTTSGSPDETYNFNCYGNITLRHIWLMYAGESGNQSTSELAMQQDSLSLDGEEHATFEDVIFDYCGNGSGGCVTVDCKNFNGNFTNCYFKNDVNSHLRYYGRAVSFDYNTSGYHIDSVSFENCTFANMGYVYMQEGGEYGDFVKVNHCTFLDVVMFPLESSWWHNLSVTNSIFQNCWMFGSIPANDTSGGNGGIFAIDSVKFFGFSVPYTDQERHILFAHSSYFEDPWLVNWMQDCPNSKTLFQNRLNDEIPVPQPFMNSRSWYFLDSLNADGTKIFPYINGFAFDTTNNPLFLAPPTDTSKIQIFLNKKWSDNTDTNWAWRPENDINAVWPMQENLAYQNSTMLTEAMGGFPLGDLFHWWPSQYTAWKAQSAAENDQISKWLMNGLVTGIKEQTSGIPVSYELSQNYPNPFNPTTNIDFSIPTSGYVSLKVYNILGQEVATIFQGFQKAGSYKANFDASKLASGVYLYRLEVGNMSMTKKLVLMK
ncbi:MAG: T9SS type A sorting domain-containing protein [Ignavibacteriaceae bacterium]